MWLLIRPSGGRGGANGGASALQITEPSSSLLPIVARSTSLLQAAVVSSLEALGNAGAHIWQLYIPPWLTGYPLSSGMNIGKDCAILAHGGVSIRIAGLRGSGLFALQ